MADTFTPNLRLIQQVNGSNPTTWGDKVDQNWDRIDSKVGGVTVLVLSGGTYTLLESEEEVAVIDVAGSLAGNVTIVFSGRKGTWVVRNRTGGAFSVNCRVVSQPGVFITQAFTANVWCDGTDIASKIESTARLIGEIIPYAGINEQPQTKWANGQAVNRVIYARLFAELGTFYGVGDGVSTFNLPDLCGRVPAGQDDMGGVASKGRLAAGLTNGVNGNVLGSSGGSDRHTLLIGELTTHSHDTSGTSKAGTAHHHDKGTLVNDAEATHKHGIGTYVIDTGQGAHTHALTTATASSGGAHTHSVSGTAASVSAGTPAGTVGNEAAHTHGINTNTGGEASHQHYSDATLYTGASGDHTHGPGNLYTGGVDANHNHDSGTLQLNASRQPSGSKSYIAEGSSSHSDGNASFGFSGSTGYISNNHGHAVSYGGTGAAGNHAHYVYGWTGVGQSHSHAINSATGAGSSHTHSFSGTALAGHAHSVTGTAASDGAHTHGLSGVTDSNGAHVHTISGKSAVGDSHTHTLSGQTGDESAHTHDIGPLTSNTKGSDLPHNNVQPTLVINYLIYTGV